MRVPAGQVRQLRDLQDCSCFLRYAYVTWTTLRDVNFCGQCPREHYCVSACHEPVQWLSNIYTGLCKCQASDTQTQPQDTNKTRRLI